MIDIKQFYNVIFFYSAGQAGEQEINQIAYVIYGRHLAIFNLP